MKDMSISKIALIIAVSLIVVGKGFLNAYNIEQLEKRMDQMENKIELVRVRTIK